MPVRLPHAPNVASLISLSCSRMSRFSQPSGAVRSPRTDRDVDAIVEAAYQRKVKETHPDDCGTGRELQRIRAAKEQFLEKRSRSPS